MIGREIRFNNRRFEDEDWSERFEAAGRAHACGKSIGGTFKVTLPRSVGIGALVDMGTADGRSAIVEDVTFSDSAEAGQFLIRGSIVYG